MYKCDDCGCVFDEPGTYRETVEFISQYDTAEWEYPCCPRCCSYQFDDVWECKICGEYYHEGETYCETVDKCYCEECIIKEMTSDYDLFKQFLKAADVEKDFYIDFVFNSATEGISDELLYIAKKDFEDGLNSTLRGEEHREIIAEYLKAGDVFLEYAAEIIDEN